MKKWKKRNLFLIVLMLVFTFIPINGQAATKVDLNKTKATMYVGNTITLKVKGTNKKVAWSSGNKKVATVSSKGKVTAKKKGTATITAKVSGKKYKCMITVKETAPTHTHSYQWIETKEPTCSLEGEKVYQCECGKIEETEVIPKLEHKYSHGTITIPVTCEKEGEKAFKCTRSGCNEIKKEPIPKTDHTPGDWVVTKEATETDTGEKVKKCMVCEVVVETGIVDKLAHSHKYSWETNGDSRTMKCACGEIGITEEYYNGVWGYFDRDSAEELYYWVNRQRGATTYTINDVDGHCIGVAPVPALTNFDGLYEIAKIRATDVVKDWSHEGMKTDNENLANGCDCAQVCYEAWCFSPGHARTMINDIYTTGSCAVFYHDADGSGENLYPVYVLVVNK